MPLREREEILRRLLLSARPVTATGQDCGYASHDDLRFHLYRYPAVIIGQPDEHVTRSGKNPLRFKERLNDNSLEPSQGSDKFLTAQHLYFRVPEPGAVINIYVI